MYAPGGCKICALSDEKISAPNVTSTFVSDQSWRQRPFVYVDAEPKQRILLVAGTLLANSWLRNFALLIPKIKSYIVALYMMQHYQHNKRTQIFCYVVLLLYYRFKFLKNITPKSVWLMPDLNNP